MMEWTTSKPTKPGWYWWRRDPSVISTIVHLYVGREDGVLFMCLEGGAGLAVDRLQGEWSSEPIPEPKEKA